MLLESLKTCLALFGALGGVSQNLPEIENYVNLDDDAIVAASRKKAKADRTKVWKLKDDRVFVSGQVIPDFKLEKLPKTGVPILRFTPQNDEPKIRLIFLPGLGASVSHMGSLIATLRVFKETQNKLATGEDVSDYIKFLSHSLELPPMEIIAFDLPGAGWGPEIESMSGPRIAQYVRDVIREVDEQKPLMNISVTRSGSGPLVLAAKRLGAPLEGLIMTAGTYPDHVVLQENFDDVKMHAAQGAYTPNWSVLNAYRDAVLSSEFQKIMNKGAKDSNNFRVMSLVGEEDGQTSVRAQSLWQKTLRMNWLNHFFRTQIVIPKTGHFVFQKQTEGSPKEDDPDIKAFMHTLNYIHTIYHRKGDYEFPEGSIPLI